VISLTQGSYYKFKVEARNSVGYSALSDSVTVLCAQLPGVTAAPTTVSVGSNVVISWSAPDDGGTAILAYGIEIQLSDGLSYSSDLANCDGSQAAIFSSRSCTVPAAVLNSPPFNLLWGSSVVAKVQTTNAVGTSAFSLGGNGATLINGPSAPLNLAENRA
jgi:hypothetical protein